MMIQITLLKEVLSDKERSNLASERTVAGMHIIPIMKDIFAAEFVITLQNSERHLVKKIQPPKTEEEVEAMEAGAVDFDDEEEEMMMKLSQGIDPVSKPTL